MAERIAAAAVDDPYRPIDFTRAFDAIIFVPTTTASRPRPSPQTE